MGKEDIRCYRRKSELNRQNVCIRMHIKHTNEEHNDFNLEWRLHQKTVYRTTKTSEIIINQTEQAKLELLQS